MNEHNFEMTEMETHSRSSHDDLSFINYERLFSDRYLETDDDEPSK